MTKRIWNKDGQYIDIQHFDLDAWIDEGWLTSEPVLAPELSENVLAPELLDKSIGSAKETKIKN